MSQLHDRMNASFFSPGAQGTLTRTAAALGWDGLFLLPGAVQCLKDADRSVGLDSWHGSRGGVQLRRVLRPLQ